MLQTGEKNLKLPSGSLASRINEIFYESIFNFYNGKQKLFIQ